ncbi:hypothetical protein BDW59DRAFT_149834 [Aspergillus cavernicola]|uniref:DUF4048 domain-containing protein n=1 Tax=Aspergillus cavernicola TaxID=176166 RepID=A0ABR4I229_9EURO
MAASYNITIPCPFFTFESILGFLTLFLALPRSFIQPIFASFPISRPFHSVLRFWGSSCRICHDPIIIRSIILLVADSCSTMGDSPGMDRAETPEASQTIISSSNSPNESLPPPRQILSKRSSLPPRPHGAARHTKRLTLNFPINIPQGVAFGPSASSSPSGSMTPATRSSARQSPVHTISTTPFDGQNDGTSLLTAIASQERRVLELREELQRAEGELDSLKKQWSSSEKTKKRTEVNHRAEVMLPLKSPDRISGAQAATTHSREQSVSGTATPAFPTQVRLSRELERRQSVLAAAATYGTSVSANGRRVFQGSHARTLSLLSPTPGSAGSKQSGSESTFSQADIDRVGRPPRSATMPSVDRTPAPSTVTPTDDMISQWRKTMPVPPPSRDLLMRTGKQMATDLKDGLWTFLEDIRQATVGDEGINATESRTMQPPRNRDSSSASRSRDRLSVQTGKLSRSPSGMKSPGSQTTGKGSKSADIDASFWGEFGIDSSGQKSASTHRIPKTPSDPNRPADPNALDVDETWDNWDTPQPKKHTPSSSRSTIESRQDRSPTTQTSSPRTSTSFGDWGHDIPDPSVSDGIPWPALTQVAPSNLTRTATNLMAEWERSLTPSSNRSPLASPGLDKDSKKD